MGENPRVCRRKSYTASDCSCEVHDLRFGPVDEVISDPFVPPSLACWRSSD